jgi:hypothetical protein
LCNCNTDTYQIGVDDIAKRYRMGIETTGTFFVQSSKEGAEP